MYWKLRSIGVITCSFTNIGFVVMSFLFPAYVSANFAPIDLVFVSMKFNHSEIWNVGKWFLCYDMKDKMNDDFIKTTFMYISIHNSMWNEKYDFIFSRCSFCCNTLEEGIYCTLPSLLGLDLKQNRRSRVYAHITLHTC